ncbi:MAG: DsbA family oxidoreductase [Meiothermus sp.]|nr:DsbA family oxidoreductase [Meiothermus sp.]
MKIEVFSDIACPWCYIGEKRLQKALQARPGLQARVEWKPFQLQPGIPREGYPWEAFMSQKFGGIAQMQAVFARVAQAGKPDGIEFNFGRVARAINTVDGHRLILWARNHHREWELADALFQAHFTDGKNLNDLDDLLGVVASVGLEVEAARAFLQSDEMESEVQASQQLAARFGIQGVPLFVFDRKYGLSGAQPVEAFLRVFDEIEKTAQV